MHQDMHIKTKNKYLLKKKCITISELFKSSISDSIFFSIYLFPGRLKHFLNLNHLFLNTFSSIILTLCNKVAYFFLLLLLLIVSQACSTASNMSFFNSFHAYLIHFLLFLSYYLSYFFVFFVLLRV